MTERVPQHASRATVYARRMRAVAMGPHGKLHVVDKPEPEPGPDDVVIAVERCGICGSDLHLRTSGMCPPGAVMGHEFAGRVAATGDQVRGLTEGQRVAVLPAGRCGVCRPCREGRDELCGDQLRVSLGLGINDGAYAEYVSTGAATCFPLPEGMTWDQGALVEPYAVGVTP